MARYEYREMLDSIMESVPDATRISIKIGSSSSGAEVEVDVERAGVMFENYPKGLEGFSHPPQPGNPKVKFETQEVTVGERVKAELVGVFYTSPSPEAEPFVAVGQTVSKGDTLCIIEAMKMMNEIESPYDGTVSAILAENGSMVEYGQAIFEIKPL